MTFTRVALVGVFAVGLLTPAYAAVAATGDTQRDQSTTAVAANVTTAATTNTPNTPLLGDSFLAKQARIQAKQRAAARAKKLAAIRAKVARYRALHARSMAPSRSRSTFAFGTKSYSKWFAREWISYKYNWDATQFGCLNALWSRESGWRTVAHNGSSGAYGIPQALPGYKMASHGSDWRTNPETQIKWGASYINGRYGNACAAWNHHRWYGWY